ncbi:MAG: RHS repeat domain-containing protein, partial [Bacteroidota bacterium]
NLLKFGNEIQVSQTGYLYIWVSNESENTEVWFDDLNVIHQKTLVAEATDYGVWGDVMRSQKWEDLEGKYRYGYQGKYAEKDEETGWNHFELREYDNIIGRWTTKDPKGQFYSPYVGMGNNPVGGVDPDGGYSKFGAAWRSAFNGGGKIYQSGDDGGKAVWGYNKDGVAHFGGDARNFWKPEAKSKSNDLLFNIGGYKGTVVSEITFGAQAGISVFELGTLDVNVASMEVYTTDPEHDGDGKTTVTNSFEASAFNAVGYKIGQEQKIRHSDYHSYRSDYKTFEGFKPLVRERGAGGSIDESIEIPIIGLKLLFGFEVRLKIQ